MPLFTPGLYSLFFSSAAYNPVNGETVYVGVFQTGPNTSDTVVDGVIPTNGTIIQVTMKTIVAGVLGSNETATVSLRINQSDTELTTGFDWTSVLREDNFTDLGVAVAMGDDYSIKIVQPTWATTPTLVFYAGTIIVRIP